MASDSQSTEGMSGRTADNVMRSLKSYRSHLTRTIVTTKRFIPVVTASIGSSSALSNAKERLISRLNEVEGYFTKILQLTIEAQEFDPTNAEKLDSDLDNDRARTDDLGEKMEKLSLKERQSYLKVLLDTDLNSRLSTTITNETEIFGPESCIAMLQNDFNIRYPLVTRRLEYFNRKQGNDELFTDFLAKSKELANLAEIDNLKKDDVLTFNALRGTTNRELLDEFLKIEEPTLERIEKTAKLYEGKRTTKAKLSDETNQVMKVRETKDNARGRGSGRRGGNNERSKTKGSKSRSN
ncbi:Hypothetical predicted protein, partial [Paramuricea clavata]